MPYCTLHWCQIAVSCGRGLDASASIQSRQSVPVLTKNLLARPEVNGHCSLPTVQTTEKCATTACFWWVELARDLATNIEETRHFRETIHILSIAWTLERIIFYSLVSSCRVYSISSISHDLLSQCVKYQSKYEEVC
jgi:hypothetical protein